MTWNSITDNNRVKLVASGTTQLKCFETIRYQQIKLYLNTESAYMNMC